MTETSRRKRPLNIYPPARSSGTPERRSPTRFALFGGNSKKGAGRASLHPWGHFIRDVWPRSNTGWPTVQDWL